MHIRKSQYSVDKLILSRWSPRAMSGETISHQELMTIFEAARWAPSSYNNQPWRFVYARKGTSHWEQLFSLLVPANQEWCKNGAVLVVIISNTLFTFNKKPSRTHSFDTGSAWENLALQASSMGLVAHGLEGFDYERARTELAIPEQYAVEAMCVLGRPGRRDELSEKLKAHEEPSDRRPLEELVFEGCFKGICKD